MKIAIIIKYLQYELNVSATHQVLIFFPFCFYYNYYLRFVIFSMKKKIEYLTTLYRTQF